VATTANFEELKAAGNAAFQSQKYQEAYNLYTEALFTLGIPPALAPSTNLPRLSPQKPAPEQVAPEHFRLCSVALCNRSAALLALGDLFGSLEDSICSLEYDITHEKARRRRDEALRRLGVELVNVDDVEIVEGKCGRGWVARRGLEAGLDLVKELAVVSVDGDGGLQELFMRACRLIMAGGHEVVFDAVCRVGRDLGGGTAEKRTELIASTLRDNSHTLFVESQGRSLAVGVGFFPFSSMFNHSCRPNCAWRYDEASKRLVHRTVRAVSAGKELTVPYVASAGVSPCERIADLAQRRGFQCACSRCADPEERDDAAAVAQRCPGGHLVLPERGTARSRAPSFPPCATCGAAVPKTALAECEEASRSVVSLTRGKSHRAACDKGPKAIETLERWLGPRHHLWHTFLAALTVSQAEQQDRQGLRASARALDAQSAAWDGAVSDDLDLFSAVVPMLRVVHGWSAAEDRAKRLMIAYELFRQRRQGGAMEFLDTMIPASAKGEREEYEKMLR
jgi:hypothetical protein